MVEQLSLMGVYAHPDDEQGATGSLIKYGRAGANTTLVVATRGEEGEIAPGVSATPQTLGAVREQEMRCAARTIGLKNLYFLDYRDSGMAGTPENESPLSFCQAPLLDVAEKVTRIVREERPHVMLTFEPWGGYGHPDHIKIHQAALIAYFLAGDPRAFPLQIEQDGLQPWTPLKLYYGVLSRRTQLAYLEALQARGEIIPPTLEGFLKRGIPDEAITTEIDVAEYVETKYKALLCHASQLGPDTLFARLPPELRLDRMRVERFMLAESRRARPEGVEHDLFQGIAQR